MFIPLFTYTHTQSKTYEGIHLKAHTQTYTHTHIHDYHTHTHIWTHTRTHTRTDKHTHAHTHTHTPYLESVNAAAWLDIPQLGSVIERARNQFITRLVKTQTYNFCSVPQQCAQFCAGQRESTQEQHQEKEQEREREMAGRGGGERTPKNKISTINKQTRYINIYIHRNSHPRLSQVDGLVG